MRKRAAKRTFIILTFNAAFINKLYGDTKRRCYLKPDPSPKVNVQLRWL